MAQTDETDPENVALAAMMAANPVMVKAWQDLMAEGTRFVTERLRQDAEAQQALLACRTPQEVMKVQSDFLTAAFAQYAEEAARIADVMTRSCQAVVDDAASGHRRRYDDVPL